MWLLRGWCEIPRSARAVACRVVENMAVDERGEVVVGEEGVEQVRADVGVVAMMALTMREG